MIERPHQLEVNFSMQNMVDASTMWALFAPIEVYSALAKKAEYSGIEYFPFRIPHTQLKSGLHARNTLTAIRSGHQSFRTERSIREVRNHPNPILAAQAFVTLPEKFASLSDLEKLQKLLGKNLPVVVYPPNEWMGESRSETFGKLETKLIQPAPELLEAWSVNTLEGFVNEARKRGYSFCLDLFHLRRDVSQSFQRQFGPWQKVIPALLPYTKEIHLGVGRNDFRGPFDSVQELKDIYSGERETDIVPMLELIRDSGWSGPIVTEIPATSVKNLVSDSRIATPSTLIHVHRQLVKNIEEILQQST